MKATEIKDFTSGNITKQLIIFSLPLFLSNLLQVVYNMVDMLIVGFALGNPGISAVSVGGDVAAFLTFVAIGFSNAGQVIIARYVGEGRRDKIGRFVGTMSVFLIISSLFISVLGLVFRHRILELMNTPSEAYSGALDYSCICMIGLVFIYGYNTVSAVLRGMGDSKHPFVFISIAAVINVALDLVFVLGFGMGAMGAALATVISQATSFIVSLIFLVRHRASFSLDVSLADFLRPDRAMLGDLVKLGTPMAIKTASIQISRLFVNSWVNSYSLAISAFSGISNKINNVANLISAAMNTAGSTMVGQNLAAGKLNRVKRVLGALAVIMLSLATLASVLFCIFPREIFGFFTDEPETLALVDGYLPIVVLLFFGSALRAIMNALLNGSSNYKVNFATAIFDGIIMRIGLSLLFGIYLDMRHYGFWLGDALAGFTPFVIGVVFYFFGSWRKAKTDSHS